MSEHVRQITPYVLTLRNLKPKARRAVLSAVSKGQLRGLEEVAVNIIKNTIPLKPAQEQVCRRWKKSLKLLALKRYPDKKKKELLQRGGFFGALLPVIATVLGSLFNG